MDRTILSFLKSIMMKLTYNTVATFQILEIIKWSASYRDAISIVGGI